MQAQAERVEHRQHLDESNRGLATLQLNEKTNSDPGGGSHLVLAEALSKSSPANGGSDISNSHAFPDREYHATAPSEDPSIFPIGNVGTRKANNGSFIPDREYPAEQFLGGDR